MYELLCKNNIKECFPNFEIIQKNYLTLMVTNCTAERTYLSLDFKGPLPSATKNKYLLIIIDEFSRFPFAYACADVSSSSVVKLFNHLFCIFGMPSYLHSDEEPSFMSSELKQFLHNMGLATIRLGLKTKKTTIVMWESVLTLSCTATYTTLQEMMFRHPQRSSNGQSIPTWLQPEKVLMKFHNRENKYEPSVDEIELLKTNSNYSYVRLQNGREISA